MKKGLGATHPAPPAKHAQLKPTSISNTLANRQPSQTATQSSTSKASDIPKKPMNYIWEPTLMTFTEKEIRKVILTTLWLI